MDTEFKAWDKENKEMKSLWDIKLCGCENIGYAVEEVINNKRYILLQYIGRKDKNRIGIYEGDIVQLGDSEVFGIIKYNEECCAYYYQSEILKVYIINIADKNIIKIIGNIYENPELLK